MSYIVRVFSEHTATQEPSLIKQNPYILSFFWESEKIGVWFLELKFYFNLIYLEPIISPIILLLNFNVIITVYGISKYKNLQMMW